MYFVFVYLSKLLTFRSCGGGGGGGVGGHGRSGRRLIHQISSNSMNIQKSCSIREARGAKQKGCASA